MSRELDREVAEKVMQAPTGKWWCPICESWVDGKDVTYDERHDERTGGCGRAVDECPNYSAFIADAWRVVEKMRLDDWLVIVKAMPERFGYLIEGSRSEYDAPCEDRYVLHGKYVCNLENMRRDFHHLRIVRPGIGSTAPEAICLAALEAVKEDK